MEKIACETIDGKIVYVDSTLIKNRESAYGILEEDRKILMVKTHSVNWEFPGGAVERGETLEDALKREFYEETGLIVDVLEEDFVRENYYYSPSGKAYHSIQHFFEVKKKSGLLNPLDPKAKTYSFIDVSNLKSQRFNRSAQLALNFYLNKRFPEYA